MRHRWSLLRNPSANDGANLINEEDVSAFLDFQLSNNLLHAVLKPPLDPATRRATFSFRAECQGRRNELSQTNTAVLPTPGSPRISGLFLLAAGNPY